MKKTLLLIVALVLVTAQVSAYTHYLRKANDTVEIPLEATEQVNISELQSEINFWLKTNRDYYPPWKSKIMLYKDFTIYLEPNLRWTVPGYEKTRASIGSIRVYGGLERVRIIMKPHRYSFGFILKLKFIAYGSYGSTYGSSNNTYSTVSNYNANPQTNYPSYYPSNFTYQSTGYNINPNYKYSYYSNSPSYYNIQANYPSYYPSNFTYQSRPLTTSYANYYRRC